MSHRTIDPALVFADAFVERWGQDAARDLEAIAPKLGLRITYVEADAFEGVLRRIKGRMLGTIALSRSVSDSRRRRFTLAHELGHYILPTHVDSSSPCRPKDIERWDASLHAREVEANRFAASALMPRGSIADLFGEEPSFNVVESIAKRRGTSLTSSAYRYVQLSGDRVAVVWSENGEVKWARGSDELYRHVNNGQLSGDTFGARASRDLAVPDAFDRVPAEAWFEEKNMRAGATILEHSKRLGSYGVLTLLWIDEPIERWSDYADLEEE